MISDGVEMVVCEQCGDVTVRYESMIRADLSREDFARHLDDRFLKKLLDIIEEEDASLEEPPFQDHVVRGRDLNPNGF